MNPPPRPDLEVEHPLSVLSCHPASVRPVRHRNVTPWATGRAARCRSTRCPIAPSAAPPDHPQGPDPQVRQHAAGGGTLLASSGQAGDGVGVAGMLQGILPHFTPQESQCEFPVRNSERIPRSGRRTAGNSILGRSRQRRETLCHVQLSGEWRTLSGASLFDLSTTLLSSHRPPSADFRSCSFRQGC